MLLALIAAEQLLAVRRHVALEDVRAMELSQELDHLFLGGNLVAQVLT